MEKQIKFTVIALAILFTASLIVKQTSWYKGYEKAQHEQDIKEREMFYESIKYQNF